jgi:signal transduction histidine kinase
MTATGPPETATVLVVDDSPANLLLLERMLERTGFEPLTARSGELALEAARARAPDLILLDISMPDMDGYEVCERLKADAALRDIPVIFISARNQTIDKVKAFGVGGVDYITKPFQFEEVQARIRTHLRLRRLERLRDDLTQMVIHDLRNPLTVICGFLDILEGREAQALSAGTQALVTVARRSAEDLLMMIGSILDVARMGAGAMKLRREPCDLGALARSVLAATQPLPGDRAVTIDAHEPAPGFTADVALLRRVLQNLLGNALRYTPAGGVVRVVVAPSPGEIRVAITDAGPGIAPEHQGRIFEKFGQVGDRRNRVGSGLGLTFCKLAVEAHGGRIGVESEVGRGSTFWVTLPRPADGAGPPGEGTR